LTASHPPVKSLAHILDNRDLNSDFLMAILTQDMQAGINRAGGGTSVPKKLGARERADRADRVAGRTAGQLVGLLLFAALYFVDINGILNHPVYERTIEQCGVDGSLCQTLNAAPVCQSINSGKLIPGSRLFSAFSFDCIPTNGIGQTNCSQAPYAGCMTAPCFPTAKPGIVQCSCPVFDGPYQVGQNEQVCTLGDDLVWSAAYAPPNSSVASDARPASAGPMVPAAIPSPGTCLPDAPGAAGCPLYVSGKTVLPPDSGVDCPLVCQEYQSCRQGNGIQAGFSCDAALCTDECNDRDLMQKACTGLSACDLSEIIEAETAAGCSCCASQLCGCEPNGESNAVIASLDRQQRERGITPQCDINGTLCGSS
jgi:hypothetical protein